MIFKLVFLSALFAINAYADGLGEVFLAHIPAHSSERLVMSFDAQEKKILLEKLSKEPKKRKLLSIGNNSIDAIQRAHQLQKDLSFSEEEVKLHRSLYLWLKHGYQLQISHENGEFYQMTLWILSQNGEPMPEEKIKKASGLTKELSQGSMISTLQRLLSPTSILSKPTFWNPNQPLSSLHSTVLSSVIHFLPTEEILKIRRLSRGLKTAVDENPLPPYFILKHPDVNTVTFSPSGKYVATASRSHRTVQIWNAHTGHLLQSIQLLLTRFETLFSVSFSPDDSQFRVITNEMRIKVLDLASGNVISEEGPFHKCSRVSFSPSGTKQVSMYYHDIDHLGVPYSQLLLAMNHVYLVIKDLASGRIDVSSTVQSNFPMTQPAFSPDESTLLTVSSDRCLKLWSPFTEHPVRTIDTHNLHHLIPSVSFSKDGKKFVSTSGDKTIKIWDFQSGQLIHTLDHPQLHRLDIPVDAIFFQKDSKILAKIQTNPKFKIWDAITGQEIQLKSGDPLSLPYKDSFAFSPDEKKFAAIPANSENMAIIWNLE